MMDNEATCDLFFFRYQTDKASRKAMPGKPLNQMFRLLSCLLPGCLGTAVMAQNRHTGPYESDADTLHLWHLDESAAPAADDGTPPFPLQGLLNQATLGNPAPPGFGTALHTHTGTTNAFGILALQPSLASNSSDDAPANFKWFGTHGAFTLEALVRLDTLPLDTPGGALSVITMDGDSSERVFSFRIDKSATPSLSFLSLPNSGVSPAAESFDASIPLSGPHALATDVWFHVAVTYDGNAGASQNLKLYWTRLDSGAAAANPIGTHSLPADFTAVNGDFALGNDARSAAGENEVWPGRIDEVRISGIARAATDFLFHTVTLAGASGSDGNLPQNTLDANFATRWSAQGIGQWITYDLGTTRDVSGLSIAFHSGNTRTATFDVLVSPDNTNWQTVLSNAVSSGTTTHLEWFGFASVPARFVRFLGRGNSVNSWNSLTEVVIGLPDGGDGDRDGLSDSWEIFYFGNLAQGATSDPDGDGLNNLHEFQNAFIPALTQNVGDADGDGLPDAWEIQFFGSLTQSDSGDFDRDGSGNATEYQNESNPTQPNSVPGDLDGDNLPDLWEASAFGNLTNWAYDDADGDGYNNLAERVAGTSPTDSNARPPRVAPRVAFLNDSVVATDACVMPNSASFGRALNGVSYQSEILITFNGYQYTAWYDTVGTTQTVWLARRSVAGTSVGAWEAVNTGSLFVNGKATWNSHNTISLGISPLDGTLHMAWDHHVHNLRYRVSVVGLCTTNTTAWGPGMMHPEQNWLVASGQTVTRVTYPYFFNSPSGELVLEYRFGNSGNGTIGIQYYNPATGTWNPRWQIVTPGGTYVGLSNGGTRVTSTSRNAYGNGFDFSPDGTLHYTWTFREGNGAFNHDLHYARSTDGGVTWLNQAGGVVANRNTSQSINITSPGTIFKAIDGNQQMINQQAQCVDEEGRVHVVMSHRRVEPGFEWQSGDGAFSGADTAYYHYFRDPGTQVWAQRRLPVTYPVTSRPKVGHDQQENVYVVFRSGPRLVVASASKTSSYTDWTIAAVADYGFGGEPLIDQNRLTADGILSVFLQEDAPASTSPTGTPLHVMEFVVNVPVPNPVSIMMLKADVVVSMATEVGFTYQLQTSSSLAPGNWTNLGAAASGTGGLRALTHANGTAGPRRFYRVVITQ
jgi:hypothetical protein